MPTRGRSDTFGTPKGREKSHSTQTKNVTQPSPHKRKTAAAWQWCETAKHHLNPSAGKAKNDQSQGAEVAPLEPLKEKKRARVRRPDHSQGAPLEPLKVCGGTALALEISSSPRFRKQENPSRFQAQSGAKSEPSRIQAQSGAKSEPR